MPHHNMARLRKAAQRGNACRALSLTLSATFLPPAIEPALTVHSLSIPAHTHPQPPPLGPLTQYCPATDSFSRKQKD